MEEPIVERFLLGNLAKEEKEIALICDRGDGISEEHNEEDRLKATKAEMNEMRKENERLKMVLAQVVNDYKSLQVQVLTISKQEPTNHHREDENELVSLTLGRQANDQQPKKTEKRIQFLNECKQDEKFNEGLKLGLDCRFEPALNERIRVHSRDETSFDGHKEDEPCTEAWPLGKSLKTMRSVEDEILQHQQTQLKRARVSVRARCETPTMNDGCQWRKYGQKTAKGNPCPRAYYRCTVSPLCPVRKQVQRCADDTSILITTYEGNHNHPLPISATSMASTTSAAATMLRTGSSTSTTTTNSTALPMISTLNSHPTITLDLTSLPKYPSSSSNTCLNFSSNSTISDIVESPWGSSGDYLSYGAPLHTRSSKANVYQPFYMQTNNQNGLLPALIDQKAGIASDPRFRSAVEAALTSLISKSGDQGGR